MRGHLLRTLTLLFACSMIPVTHAALIDRGGGLIYDDVQDITWLQDANYAKTTGYDADGRMSWDNAVFWADNLSYYDAVRDTTHIDWRLPGTMQPDPSCDNHNANNEGYGDNCTGSELGYLNNVYGIAVGASSPFLNIPSSAQNHRFWSGTESINTSYAWYYDFATDRQNNNPKTSTYHLWAVMDGDVGLATPIPVPAAAWLFGSALGLSVWFRRRKEFTRAG